jgi:YVTN family beta-propeller protein
MNRSFTNVLFGAFGQVQASATTSEEPRPVHTATAEEAADILTAANKVVIVSTADDKIVKVLDSRGYPDLVTMEPTGRYALVTNRYADAVSVIDVTTHKEIRRIHVGKAPHGMALRPEESRRAAR